MRFRVKIQFNFLVIFLVHRQANSNQSLNYFFIQPTSRININHHKITTPINLNVHALFFSITQTIFNKYLFNFFPQIMSNL